MKINFKNITMDAIVKVAICQENHTMTIDDCGDKVTVHFKKNIIYDYYLSLSDSLVKVTHPDYGAKHFGYDIKVFNVLFSDGLTLRKNENKDSVEVDETKSIYSDNKPKVICLIDNYLSKKKNGKKLTIEFYKGTIYNYSINSLGEFEILHTSWNPIRGNYVTFSIEEFNACYLKLE